MILTTPVGTCNQLSQTSPGLCGVLLRSLTKWANFTEFNAAFRVSMETFGNSFLLAGVRRTLGTFRVEWPPRLFKSVHTFLLEIW